MRTRRSASSSSDPVPSRHAHFFDTNATNGKRVGHRSVLLHESVNALELRPDNIVVDATLGGGGHAKGIVERLGVRGVFIGIDADAEAVERVRTLLNDPPCTIHLAVANFRTLTEVLHNCGTSVINSAFFDLGWSGYQIAAGRGFSFLADEPLLMTYAKDVTPETLTAEKIVNEWAETSIADVLFGWGEERFAKRIAKGIIEYRSRKRITRSNELADIVRGSVPNAYRRGRLHPATKTFQALRIAVNDELGALKEGLRSAWKALTSGGRIAVITFHSIEDREVKYLFLEWERMGEGTRITRSPIKPGKEELLENPRARSAKLRVIQKI